MENLSELIKSKDTKFYLLKYPSNLKLTELACSKLDLNKNMNEIELKKYNAEFVQIPKKLEMLYKNSIKVFKEEKKNEYKLCSIELEGIKKLKVKRKLKIKKKTTKKKKKALKSK